MALTTSTPKVRLTSGYVNVDAASRSSSRRRRQANSTRRRRGGFLTVGFGTRCPVGFVSAPTAEAAPSHRARWNFPARFLYPSGGTGSWHHLRRWGTPQGCGAWARAWPDSDRCAAPCPESDYLMLPPGSQHRSDRRIACSAFPPGRFQRRRLPRPRSPSFCCASERTRATEWHMPVCP